MNIRTAQYAVRLVLVIAIVAVLLLTSTGMVPWGTGVTLWGIFLIVSAVFLTVNWYTGRKRP